VTIDGGIWAQRQAVNRDLALPHGFGMLEQAGNFENLRIAAGHSDKTYRGPVFMDSDVYKWLEAASFELRRQPSTELEVKVNEAIALVEAAQGADGYINSYYTVAEPGQRWTDFGHGHELYCAGHLFQAAVAHHRATGSDRLLGVATRFADYIDSLFGPGKQSEATPGHPEIEMALVELYRATGEKRYLDLAGVFLSNRGRGWLGPSKRYGNSTYFQDRVPVRESSEVEGHAVRALYLTTGVADVYLETGEQALLDALERQWQDLVFNKLYLTGGVGSRHLAEAFGKPYELPNELAYCETCAAIADVMWNWRMLLATGEGRFADVIERSLYNAILSGISLDGQRYFYVNPLSDDGAPERLHRGGPERREWHLVACCPPNVMRLFASLGHYYATRSKDGAGLQIHLYGPARIAAGLADDRHVELRMEGSYPWEGEVKITVDEADGSAWPLSLRIPGWRDATLTRARRTATRVNWLVRVNGEGIGTAVSPSGYLTIERAWNPGDVIELSLPLEPRLTEAHPYVEATRGCVAIERGPLVYCLEQPDQDGVSVRDLEIDPTAPLESAWQGDLLDGVTVVRAGGSRLDDRSWRGKLYRPVSGDQEPERQPATLTAIPYYAWANRGPAAMRVWIPRG
jgi:DUF1680 family protein